VQGAGCRVCARCRVWGYLLHFDEVQAPGGLRVDLVSGFGCGLLRTTTSQKCEAVPRRARISGS